MYRDAISSTVDSHREWRSRNWSERPVRIDAKYRYRVNGRVVADRIKELARGGYGRFAEHTAIGERRSRHGS